MFNLIIVEDENMLREKLARIVNFSDYNFNLTGTFSNGLEAIEYISENHVDFILTDIKMPKATGIDIARYVSENMPNTKVVLISGYDDFEYARTAIKYNVSGYISKPFKLSEFTQILTDINSALLKEANKKTLSDLSIRQFFHELCYGLYKDEATVSHIISNFNLDIDLNHDTCIYFTINIKNPDIFLNNPDHISENLSNITQNIIQLTEPKPKYCFLVNFSAFYYEYLVIYKGNFDFNEDISMITEQIANVMNKLGFSVTVKKVIPFNSISDMLNNNTISLSEQLKNLTQTFIDYLITNNFENLETICDVIFKTINKYPESLYDTLISDFAENINRPLRIFFNTTIDFSEAMSQDSKQKTDSAKKAVNSFIHAHKTPNVSLISIIKTYIENNFQNHLTLDEVAQHVFLSKVYLCQYIKQQTSMTFTNYLTKVRIEKAMELLKDPTLKIYTISEMVGYKTNAYFIRLFKSYTGITPTEYRKNLDMK